MNETNNENTNISELFEIKAARELLRGAKKIPRGTLLGELWGTGEIAVVFGGTAAGKSIFAVQLAEALAGGRSVEPFSNVGGQQKVIYLDLERPAAQFIKRYSPEPDPETHRITGEPYKFSLNLTRVGPKNEARMEPEALGSLIAATGARVLVIDNLQYFMKYGVPREAAAVMRELRRLRNRLGISILVTMNATRSAGKRGITAADLPCSAVITAAADSVFAIGRCVSRSHGRYIKHVKAGSQDTALGADHVAYFVIEHRDGNFPAFKFINYTTEEAALAADGGRWESRRLNDVNTLREQGMTIRAIAERLGMSRSAVHRRTKIAKDFPTG